MYFEKAWISVTIITVTYLMDMFVVLRLMNKRATMHISHDIKDFVTEREIDKFHICILVQPVGL